jgi:hypothetical protein
MIGEPDRESDDMTSETKDTKDTKEAKIDDAGNDAPRANESAGTKAPGRTGSAAVAVSLAWLAVGIPLLWGVVQTLRRSLALFG